MNRAVSTYYINLRVGTRPWVSVEDGRLHDAVGVAAPGVLCPFNKFRQFLLFIFLASDARSGRYPCWEVLRSSGPAKVRTAAVCGRTFYKVYTETLD